MGYFKSCISQPIKTMRTFDFLNKFCENNSMKRICPEQFPKSVGWMKHILCRNFSANFVDVLKRESRSFLEFLKIQGLMKQTWYVDEVVCSAENLTDYNLRAYLNSLNGSKTKSVESFLNLCLRLGGLKLLKDRPWYPS